MTTYGSRPQDLVVDSRGNALRGVTLKLYGSEAAANAGGTPDGTAVTDSRGRWSYEAVGQVWARLSDGTVWQVSTDEGIAASAEAAAVAAQSSADSAVASAAQAQSAATSAAGAQANAKSVYQIWLDEGNVGTEQDFLDTVSVRELGFRPLVQETAPSSSTIDGYPVVWLKPTGTLAAVPVLPTSPSWDNLNSEFTVPTGITGAYYTMDGETLTPGVAIPVTDALPVTKTITAVAQPGYTLSGTYSWAHTFPDPAAVTLVQSDDFTGANGNISGRAFNNALGGTGALSFGVNANNNLAIASNQLANTTTVGGAYRTPMGFQNMRVEIDVVSWGYTGTSQPLYLAIGGTTSWEGCFIALGQGRLTIYSNAASGNTVLLNEVAAQSTGTWSMELFDYQLGIKKPGGSWVYYDVSAILPASKRSDVFYVRSAVSSATASFVLDNLKIYSLGA